MIPSESWNVTLLSGETVHAQVTMRDGYFVARVERRGVPNESAAMKPRAAILRAVDMAGMLGDVASLTKEGA